MGSSLSDRSSCLTSTQLQEGHTHGVVDLSHQICSKLNWTILGFIIELWNLPSFKQELELDGKLNGTLEVPSNHRFPMVLYSSLLMKVFKVNFLDHYINLSYVRHM